MDRYEETQDNTSTRSLSVIVFLAGIWLIISPFILSYSSSGVQWDQFIFGIIIAVLAAIRFFANSAHWASWLAALAGLWMIIAPYAISTASTGARWASVIGGIVALVVALVNTNTSTQTHIHHGHPAT